MLDVFTMPAPPLFAGGAEDTIVTCIAMFDLDVVNTEMDLFYEFTWLDRSNVEVVASDRISVSQSHNTSFLTLSPLSTEDTNFTCQVSVTVSQNVLTPGDEARSTATLDIQGEYHTFHNPTCVKTRFKFHCSSLWFYCSSSPPNGEHHAGWELHSWGNSHSLLHCQLAAIPQNPTSHRVDVFQWNHH